MIYQMKILLFESRGCFKYMIRALSANNLILHLMHICYIKVSVNSNQCFITL